MNMKKLLYILTIALILLSGCDGPVVSNNKYPYVVYTRTGPDNYYCKEIDAENRTAHNCYGTTTKNTLASYHLGPQDTWGIR